MPLYDADQQAASGIPPGAEGLGRRIGAADGLMIASPEYNFSLPGTLKNAIDWVSLLAASKGQVGGIRGLWQLRIPLEGLGVLLHPDMYTLPWAGKAFGPDGRLIEQERQDRLAAMVEGYLTVARELAAG
jgi:chromate reductase